MNYLKNPFANFVLDEIKDASDPAGYAPMVCRSERAAAKWLAWKMYAQINNAARSRGTDVAFEDGLRMAFTYRVRAYRVVVMEQVHEVFVAYLGEASTGCGGETIIIGEFDDDTETVEQLTDAVQDYAIWDESFNEYALRFEMQQAA